jgi:hypothetical protein
MAMVAVKVIINELGDISDPSSSGRLRGTQNIHEKKTSASESTNHRKAQII